MPVASWLVDTNVLLRLLQPDSPDFPESGGGVARSIPAAAFLHLFA